MKYSVLISDSLYDLTAIIPIEKIYIYILTPNNLCNGFINKLLDTNLHHIVSQYIYIKYLFINLFICQLFHNHPKKTKLYPAKLYYLFDTNDWSEFFEDKMDYGGGNNLT